MRTVRIGVIGAGNMGHDALYFEAAETARCITVGRLQSPLRPLDDSLTTLRAMDGIRRRYGISFPALPV
ncbi:hypothetical protein [Streptomyces sp. NPDC096132]|uniref:hypothetical protein n=1 Tax=Streptomyces sp. NPDC096132 TaxID=3366075 RepID=UPI003827674E